MNRLTHSVLVLALTALLLTACEEKTETPRPAPPPPPAYSGPDFLQTTIGSMSAVRGYQPQLVSGFGLVAKLRHTGSPDCPPALRAWFLNEIASKGFGRESLGFGKLSPAQVLASDTTAVVLVEGIIPPGATQNSRFDVIVSALPGTSTTSLEGGVLYAVDLRISGADVGRPSSQILASASGDLFLNPFNPASGSPDTDTSGGSDTAGRTDNLRTARILSGGQVIVSPLLALQLNQPSYLRSRQIADRINGRFPQMPADRRPLADAKSDEMIQLNVISAFADDPKRMIELVSALFINPTDRFNHDKALELRAILEKSENHRYAPQITLAWQAMGPNQLPFLRSAYDHADPVVRLAALEAGARLGDLRAAEPLFHVAVANQPDTADRAVAMLGQILRRHTDNIRVATMLRQLLDADDSLVRLTAFDALANVGDPIIQIRPFTDKFELAMVPSAKPMIYVTRRDLPRIVVFDDNLSFNRPLLFSSADNALMLRLDQNDTNLSVYYRSPDQPRGSTTQLLPLVANLIYLMANQPTDRAPTPGFDMTYSQVVRNLHLLANAHAFNAPIVLEPSDLIHAIAQQKQSPATPGSERPESTTASGASGGPAPTPPNSTSDQPQPIRWRDIPSENSNSPVAPKPSTGDNPPTE
ncbi:MAG: flagellar basal body P-ring protein FlgI [Phycisphaerales bacterium]